MSLSDVKPLGSYSLDATAEDGPATVTVATKDGPLRVAGHGTFAPPSRFAFRGEARGEGAGPARSSRCSTSWDRAGPTAARAFEIRST